MLLDKRFDLVLCGKTALVAECSISSHAIHLKRAFSNVYAQNLIVTVTHCFLHRRVGVPTEVSSLKGSPEGRPGLACIAYMLYLVVPETFGEQAFYSFA